MANDDEITSAELDGLLDDAETLSVGHLAGATEVWIYVAVDGDTLHELEQRAARTGAAVTEAASAALRAGVQVA